MASTVYFGNAERFVPIPAPFTAADASHTGFSSVIQLLNGGAIVEDSLAQHREWSWSWIGDPANLNIVKQFLQGTYGPGPFYWTDPFASDVNLFAPNWGAPRLVDTDWKEIHDVPHTSLATTTANAYGHPGKSAVYNLATVAASYVPYRRFTIMIPPGQTLYIGASGSVSGSALIAVRPTSPAGVVGSVVENIPLAVTGAMRYFATSYPSTTARSVEVFLSRSAAATSIVNLLNNPNGRYTTTGLGILNGSIGQDAGLDTYNVVANSSTAGNAGIVIESPTVGGGKLLPNTTYTFSAYIYSSFGTAELYATGAGVTAGVISPVVTGFTRTSITFTTSASGVVNLYVLNATNAPATGQNIIAFRDAQLEVGSVATPYFDGSTTVLPDSASWAGTANGSISTRLISATITLASMSAILSPTGTVPLLTGPFLGGEGSTGLRFVGGLKETLYTAGGLNQPRRKGYSIRLVETEAWEL